MIFPLRRQQDRDKLKLLAPAAADGFVWLTPTRFRAVKDKDRRAHQEKGPA